MAQQKAVFAPFQKIPGMYVRFHSEKFAILLPVTYARPGVRECASPPATRTPLQPTE